MLAASREAIEAQLLSPRAATMRALPAVSPDTILLLDSVRGSPGGGEQSMSYLAYDPSQIPANVQTVTGYGGIRSIAVSSHNFKSASVAFFDGHAETVLESTFLNDTNYHASHTLDPGNTANGCLGDVDILASSSTKGYWTAAAGD